MNKIFLVFTCFIFIIYLFGFFICQKEETNFMNQNFTKGLKGFSILLIVWCHIGAILDANNIQFIAGIGVSIFLICSGFGLEQSYKKNGLKKFWQKKFFKICIPFWIVEFLGICITEKFDLELWVLDFFFIKPATSYGWYMQYVMICYIIYFLGKLLLQKFANYRNIDIYFYEISFLIYFIVKSTILVNENIPFLESRQMLSFLFGILLSKRLKDRIGEENHIKVYILSAILIIIGLAFMGITQLSSIKNGIIITQNILSLLTVFPISVGVILFFKQLPFLINFALIELGCISFEIYLVHAFSLKIIKQENLSSLITFIIVTICCAYLMCLLGGRKYGRFNSNHFN